jgi:hypothetical protein
MSDLYTITCHFCHQTADFESFISTPVNGDLPQDQFQCPHCRRAWRLLPNPKRYGPGRLLVETEAVL